MSSELETRVEQDGEIQRSGFILVLITVSLLLFGHLITYLARKLNHPLFSDALVLLVFGLLVGGIGYSIGNSFPGFDAFLQVSMWNKFEENLFFFVLLPPIIFDSGYTLRRDVFFHNIGVISSLAWFGTIFSCLIIGSSVFGISKLPNVYSPSITECMVFGALISATDPVTVIAVFNQMGVTPFLHILVLGESVLNDAVALVLYQTMTLFASTDGPVQGSQVGFAILNFLLNSLGSVLFGIALGMISSILFKFVNFGASDAHVLECGVALMFPFLSYSGAACLKTSSIISILFTGIVMASYTKLNMTAECQKRLEEFYGVLAHLAEMFIFIFLGISVFSGKGDWSSPSILFGLVAFVIITVARYLSLMPLLCIANKMRSDENEISIAEQIVVCWSGLRGGMAFALSAASVNELPNSSSGKVFVTATTICIFLSILTEGSSINWICEFLRVDNTVYPLSTTGNNTCRWRAFKNLDPPTSTELEMSAVKSSDDKLESLETIELENLSEVDVLPRESTTARMNWWERFDRGFLVPLLVRNEAFSQSS